MMLLLDISSSCSDPALAVVLSIVKKAMTILWIVGPILAIVGAVMAFFKLMSNPEEKKYKNLFKNMIMALLFLFFIPAIVNVVMGLLDDTFEFTACWNQAEALAETAGQKSTYIDPNDRDKTNIYTDPGQYKTGEKKSGTSTSNSTNSSSNSSSSSNTVSSSSATNSSTKKMIFVGDSRTVGMKSAVDNEDPNDVWSCKTSMGLDWLKSTGVPAVESHITQGSSLIILMGINDLYHVDSYINYMNSLAPSIKAKGANLYFVSVNPTSRSADYLNSDISNFNSKMKSGLSSSVKYIDTHTYLLNNGFSSNDGIHYTATTYKQIYALIKNNL